jgi:hypothetical protein
LDPFNIHDKVFLRSRDLDFPSSFWIHFQHFIHWFVYLFSQQVFIVHLLVTGSRDNSSELNKPLALISLPL